MLCSNWEKPTESYGGAWQSSMLALS